MNNLRSERAVFLAIALAFGCDSSVGPTAVQQGIRAETISVEAKTVSLIVGQTRQLSISQSAIPITWQSDNPDVVAISPAGVAAGRMPGTAHAIVRSKAATDTTTITVHGGVSRVELTSDSVAIAAGRNSRLAFLAYDSSDVTIDSGGLSLSDIKWNSTEPSVATVSSDGVVSALAVGQTKISLGVDGAVDTGIVNVVQVPISAVNLSAPGQFSISVGGSYKIVATTRDADGNDLPGRVVTWASSNAGVTTVSSDGKVTGVNTGSARITATSEGQSAYVDIFVLPAPVASVTVMLASSSIDTSHVTQATAVARDASGKVLTGLSVGWSSDNPAVATVSSLGSVRGVSPGVSTITAVVEGVEGSMKLSVVSNPPNGPTPSPISSIAVSIASSSLLSGQTTQASATLRDSAGNVVTGHAMTWSSSDVGIATVASSGLVTAVAVGSATITVSSAGKSASVVVNVSKSADPPAAIAVINVSPSVASLSTGQSVQAAAVARDAGGNVLNGRTFSWTSSNPNVATVNSSGSVSALASGVATISATSQGVAGNETVNVTSPGPTVVPNGALASHDFEDGTLGPYWNPWGTAIDVVPDPTGSGHGNVARFHYAAASADDNKALAPKSGFGVGLGDSVWFQGDFYLPADVNDEPVESMRKLNYWGSINDGYHFREQFGMVLTLQGSQLEVSNTAVGPSNLPTEYTYTPAFISKGVWHKLQVQLKVNSSFVAQDGILRIWLDGVVVYDRTNMRWTDPLWSEDPATYKWEAWGIGYQMQSPSPYDEYRYWDNMVFSKTRIQP